MNCIDALPEFEKWRKAESESLIEKIFEAITSQTRPLQINTIMNNQRRNFEDLYAKAVQAGISAAAATDHGDNSPARSAFDIEKSEAYGFAWVKIRPANSSFGRWLKAKGIVKNLGYKGGYDLWIRGYDLLVAKKTAYAEAMAAVLRLGGINAIAEFRVESDAMKQVTLGITSSSISSAAIQSDGNLVVDRYDSGSDSDQWFGNDVASLLIVSSEERSKILTCLEEKRDAKPYPEDEVEILLVLLREQFKTHHQFKEWLEEKKIPYKRKFDPRV